MVFSKSLEQYIQSKPERLHLRNYVTTPQVAAENRVIEYPRGHMLGGTSSISVSLLSNFRWILLNMGVDGMWYTRGSEDDFNRFSSVTGDPGWSWAAIQPYFRKVKLHCVSLLFFALNEPRTKNGPSRPTTTIHQISIIRRFTVPQESIRSVCRGTSGQCIPVSLKRPLKCRKSFLLYWITMTVGRLVLVCPKMRRITSKILTMIQDGHRILSATEREAALQCLTWPLHLSSGPIFTF